jgi:hypothetical protein
MTRHEPSLRGTFNGVPYQILLKSCRNILQKISQSRISSTYFSVYDHDRKYLIFMLPVFVQSLFFFFFINNYLDNPATTQKLLTLRRDAVSAVIFCFYILAGSFRYKRQVLSHPPSPMMSRKFLFDAMMELHKDHDLDVSAGGGAGNMPELSLNSQLLEVPKAPSLSSPIPGVLAPHKGHRLWAIVHEASFSRTFTEISEELEKIIAYSKFILGEEKLI